MKAEWNPPTELGEKSEVNPGEYQAFFNETENIVFDPSRYTQMPISKGAHMLAWLPGVNFRGYYHLPNESSITTVSFLYYKLSPSKILEDKERLIVVAGFGYGEHHNHQGQPPAWYLAGRQIGVIEPQYDTVTITESPGSEIPIKHFSLACIVDGPYGEPKLANSSDSKQ